MKNFILTLILVVLTSFFFFPFSFTFLPTVNTKMMLAVGGGVLLFIRLSQQGLANLNTEIFKLSIYALGVSFASIISMTLNGTPDNSYVSFIVSMFVWLSAGYFVIEMIKKKHGYLSVELVCYYLIAVAVAQCFLAIMIDSIPAVKSFIDNLLYGIGFMGKNKDRLYGLGCALDVAGGRFAALLMMIAFLLPRVIKKDDSNINVFLLLFAYGVIAIIGNFISRTTTVGLVLSLLYIFYVLASNSVIEGYDKNKLTRWFVGAFLVISLSFIILYNISPQWKNYMEFGFEGFFSLVEKGRWEVHSNDMLTGQFVFPENLRGWLIGEGYIASTDIDPYYIGKTWHGFYKGTDVGYSRFLLYFGLMGLSAFFAFMIKTCQICMKYLKEYRMMFLALLTLNFIIWFKVSTDLFIVFVPFLCLAIQPFGENEIKE